MNSNEHEYHTSAAPDVSKKASLHIWLYFLSLGLVLFLMLIGLTIYFRFQVDFEQRQKIGQVQTKEILDHKAMMTAILSGKVGLFPEKKNVDIDTAMERFINDIRSAK